MIDQGPSYWPKHQKVSQEVDYCTVLVRIGGPQVAATAEAMRCRQHTTNKDNVQYDVETQFLSLDFDELRQSSLEYLQL